MNEPAVISSVVIQVRPGALEATRTAVDAMACAEVHATDPRGRLVVVLETGTDGALAGAMHDIGALPGVLGVNLVFHHSDTGTPREAAVAEENP